MTLTSIKGKPPDAWPIVENRPFLHSHFKPQRYGWTALHKSVRWSCLALGTGHGTLGSVADTQVIRLRWSPGALRRSRGDHMQ
jgi:hypothetical protein